VKGFRRFVLGQHDTSERACTQSSDAFEVFQSGSVLTVTEIVHQPDRQTKAYLQQ